MKGNKKTGLLQLFLRFLPLAAAVSALPLLTGRIYYMVADDYLLNSIACGAFGRDGSPYLVFIRTPAGLLLKWLYGIAPSVNWYAAMLIALISISFAVLAAVIWKRSGSFLLMLLVFLVNAIIVPFFFTFTVTAFVLAGAGGALWFYALSENEEKGALAAAVCGSLIFAASDIMRKDSFVIGAAAACPLLLEGLHMRLGAARRKVRPKRNVFRLAAAPLVLAAAIGASVLCDRGMYSNPDWKAFMSYTDARSSVVDEPAAPYAPPYSDALAEAGFTELDYKLLQGWKFAEKPVFSEEALAKAGEIGKTAVTQDRRRGYFKNVFAKRSNVLYLLIPAALFAALLAAGRRSHIIPGLLTLLIFYGTVFGLVYVRMRYVYRVSAPVMGLAALMLILENCDREKRSGKTEKAPGGRHDEHGLKKVIARAVRRVLTVLFAAVMLACAVAYFQAYRKANRIVRMSQEEMPMRALAEEIRSHPDRLYICDAAVLSSVFYYGTPVTKVGRTTVPRNAVRSGSWDTFSPRYYAQTEQFIPDPDRLLTSLVTAENVYYVSGGNGGISAFLEEQTGRAVTYEVQDFNGVAAKILKYRYAD